MTKANRSLKKRNLIDEIRQCIDQGFVFDTRHATDRQSERRISRVEIFFVLKNGRHEKSKDRYQKGYEAWNYSIRGMTVDKKEIRVVISFDLNAMLIITAIELRSANGKKS